MRTPSQWPSLRRRTRALASEIYAEAVAEIATLAGRALPPPAPGVPTIGARLANSMIASIAIFVATIGRLERLIGGAGGLPVNDIREATLQELRQGAGALTDRRLLPSAYEVWIGARADGRLRLRYTYDVSRLRALLPDSIGADVCVPVALDSETLGWVRARVKRPAPGTQLAVWRALKRKMYHYDAGVVAFFGFPRNFLLSTSQWEQLLGGRPRATSAVALDVGAGDGSLSLPLRSSFAKIIATELTAPLVFRSDCQLGTRVIVRTRPALFVSCPVFFCHRLRAAGLDAVLAEDLRADWLGRSSFDVVFILNVLDRCKDPFLMLDQAHSLLTSDGWLVVSIVLPASQSDAAADTGTRQRRWNMQGDDFESGAASLVNDVFLPSGFEPLRIVRAPYFCAGDSFSPVAALDACVLVLRRIPRSEACNASTKASASASASVCSTCSAD